jgi:hypothetical protein
MARRSHEEQQGAPEGVGESRRRMHLRPIETRNPALPRTGRRVVELAGTRCPRRSMAGFEAGNRHAEADAMARIRVDLWTACPDFPLSDLHDWRATYLGEDRWSVTSTCIDPLGQYWYLE